jgi:hypothetical protein
MLARNQGSGLDSVRPMHLFDPQRDHDYYFELTREGERDALSITRCSAAHYGDVRAVPRADRTFSSARNPIPCATSSTDGPPVYEPWRPWQSSVPAAEPGGKTCCAIPGRCGPDLGRFHQQEAQQRVALFGDMSQPSQVPPGLLRGHQSQIARNLLAALEPLRLADD